MSTVEAKIVKAFKIEHHPSADRLDVITMNGAGGYLCIVGRNQFTIDDLLLYIEPNALLPEVIMAELRKNKIQMSSNRLKAIKIRGVLSEGLVLDPKQFLEPKDIKLGKNVNEILDITKYEPPQEVKMNKSGFFPYQKQYENNFFRKYTDIEPFKKYPGIFEDNDEVVATKKMHGTNSRFYYGIKANFKRSIWRKIADFILRRKEEFLVGSHNKIRTIPRRGDLTKFFGASGDVYWRIAKKYDIENLIKNLYRTIKEANPDTKSISIYGEVIGPNIQSGYEYGIPAGDLELRLFDIQIDGEYQDWDDVVAWSKYFKIDTVEEAYRGPWNIDLLSLCEAVDEYGGKKYNREGVVIKTIKNQMHNHYGRKIVKVINPAYTLDSKNSENK